MIKLKNTHIVLLLVITGGLGNTAQAAATMHRRPIAPKAPGGQKPLPPMLPGTQMRDTKVGTHAAKAKAHHDEYLAYSSRLQERTTRPSNDELKRLSQLARNARNAEEAAHKAMGGVSAEHKKMLAQNTAAKRKEREAATIKTLTQKYSGVVRTPEERAAAESAKKAAELKARANIDFGIVTKPTDAGSSNTMARALQAGRLEMERKRGTDAAKKYVATKTAAELEAGSRASEARSKALAEKRAAAWAAANTAEAIAVRQAKRDAEAAKFAGNIDLGFVTKPTDRGSSNPMARALQASRLEMESKRGTSAAKKYVATKSAAELEAGSRASEARSKALAEKRAIQAAAYAAASTPEAIAARQAKRAAEAAKTAS